MPRSTLLTSVAMVALALAGCDGEGADQTDAEEAARQILSDPSHPIHQGASLSGPLTIRQTQTAGDCSVTYFIEDRGPYQLSLYLRNTGDSWEVVDVITGHGGFDSSRCD